MEMLSNSESRALLRNLGLYSEMKAQFKSEILSFRAMNTAVEGDFLFKEFKHITQDKWAFISMPFDQPNINDIYRVNYFDTCGFVSHTHISLKQGVTELIKGHFTVPDIGRLDLLQKTECWRRGAERDQIRTVFNRGEITWDQMIKAFEQINTAVTSEG